MSEQLLNIAEQQRLPLLVSQVRKTAFFTFIATILALVSLGVAMMILAVFGFRKGSRDVEARLSIPGLVSSRFEPESVSSAHVRQIKNLFEENGSSKRGTKAAASRIGILQNSQGGWSFESWTPEENDLERTSSEDSFVGVREDHTESTLEAGTQRFPEEGPYVGSKNIRTPIISQYDYH